MALKRFRESFNTADVWNQAHFLNDQQSQPYKESLSSYKERIQESSKNFVSKLEESVKFLSAVLDEDSKKLLDAAAKKLREAKEPLSDYKVWTVPVSRFGNVCANKRIYTDKLWENVINNQKHLWKGIPGLCDHPKEADDPGELKYACIVWLDLSIDYTNKLIWGTGVFVGPLGRLLQEIIEVGGRVGFSSSGFGEKIKGTDIVNPDTYEIERVADVVINPSQSVYGDLNPENNFIDGVTQAKTVEFTKQQPITEGRIDMDKLNENDNTQQVAQPAENTQAPAQPAAQPQATEQQTQSTEQTQTAEQQQSPAQQAPAQPNQNEVKQASSAIVQAVNAAGGNLQESKFSKNARAKYVENYLKNDIKGMTLNEKIESLTSLKESLEELTDDENTAKVNEALQEAVAEKENLLKEAQELKENTGISELKEAADIIDGLEHSLETLKEDKIEADELTEAFLTRNKKLRENMKALKVKTELKEKASKRKVEKLQQQLAESKEMSNSLIDRHNKFLKTLSESESKELLKEREIVQHLSESNKSLARKVRFMNNKLKEAEELLNKARKENSALRGQVLRLQESVNKTERKLRESEIQNQKYREEQEYVNNPAKHLESSVSSKISNSLNLKEAGGRRVDAYYEDLHQRYGEAIEPFEKEIRGCHTYSEATRVFFSNRDKIDNAFREAQEAYVSPNITNQKKRAEYFKEAGMPMAESDDIAWANKVFSERMAKYNLGK